jgi:two-component system chemotaxis sensor kinase CheA
VPLSIASLDAVLVETFGAAASIPLDAVRRTLRVTAGDIVRTAQGDSVFYDGKVIPFVPLSRVLRQGAGGAREARSWSAVIVEGAGGMAALGVDRMLGMANIVFRPLPDLAPASPVIAGASLDAEGNPQLVLDCDNLVAEAQRSEAPADEPAAHPLPILIVDDSLTTRMLEQSILESAGFEVGTAASAEEALEEARRKRYALFLVDVEMPGMDGFTFIERVRADAALHGIPAILVTSRAHPEDRQRGKEVGAQGYIVKGEFDQTEFLQHVRRLIA